MKKKFRIVIAALIGISFVIGFGACSNQFDELKKSLEPTEITQTADKTENKNTTESSKQSNNSSNNQNTTSTASNQNTTPAESSENTENTQTTETSETTPPVEIEADVSYSVEHWLESTDGTTYGLDVKATQTLQGKKDSMTAAAALVYQGFTAEEITQKSIKADGSTVVKVYYDRNNITYTFNANGGKWSDNSEQKTVTGLYGAIVPVVKDPAKADAQFCDWDTVVPMTFGLENAVYEAVWLTNSLTSYKVEHCLQNIYDDDYTIDAVQVKTALPGEMTEAAPKTYTGFDTKTVIQNTVNADGSTVARIYYDRKNITYTFNLDSKYGTFADNSTSTSVTKRFGADVEVPEIIHKTVLFLEKWINPIPKTYGAVNQTFTAQYALNYYDKIVYLPAGTDGSAGTEATYVYFGVFPQSRCIQTSVLSGMSFVSTSISGTYYLGTDGNCYTRNNQGYYYRLEPIKWRVVTTNYNRTGKALLVAENILIASAVNSGGSVEWSVSPIRGYLNGSFINSAFTTNARNLLVNTQTHIDSTSSKDSVFLLSKEEIENPEYGFTTTENRNRTPTPYAEYTNANSNYAYGCYSGSRLYSWWWLRDNSNLWWCVKDGVVSYSSNSYNYVGVVPAITVTLPTQ